MFLTSYFLYAENPERGVRRHNNRFGHQIRKGKWSEGMKKGKSEVKWKPKSRNSFQNGEPNQ